jgi:DNA repair exonuclease SbcCD ATPase subunit
MNIQFTKVRWKNLLSYGNTYTEYSFKNGLDLINAKNGAGKSSIIDSVFYALFGRPYRKIKNGSLINDTTNKNLSVDIYFTIDEKDSYKVTRGQKKNVFVIYKLVEDDYVEIPEKATTREYQNFFEEEILKINETIFRQLISISTNMDTSKAFMDLTQKEKESLFQVITDTSIFNHLTTKIKDKIQEAKLQQKEIDYKLDIIDNSIQSEQVMIGQAKKQNEDFEKHHEENIQNTKENIQKVTDDVERYKEGIKKLKSLKEKYDEQNEELIEYKQELTNLYMEAQKISEDELEEMHSVYEYESKKLDVWFYGLKYEELNEEKINLYERISKNSEKISELSTKITHIEAAKKGSIECKYCSTVNYLVAIDEKEIVLLDTFKNEIITLKENNKKILSKISEVDKTLDDKKEQDKIEYNTKRDELLKTRNSEQKILKHKNYSHKRAERDELQDKINRIISILEEYKEKLLKSKHIKQTLKENEDLVNYYKQKLIELKSIKMIEIDETSLETKKDQQVIIKTELSSLTKILQDYNYLFNMLSDKGENNLKGQVISRTVPLLNKGINYFLERFSLNEFNFIIDENFKEKIISRDNNSEYNSLSNGQKARISFSIMFSFLKLIEEKSGVATNLLLLDEVLDTSLDSRGREELLMILGDEFKGKKNVIIISHSDEIKEKTELFDRTVSIEKEKFSKLKITDL